MTTTDAGSIPFCLEALRQPQRGIRSLCAVLMLIVFSGCGPQTDSAEAPRRTYGNAGQGYPQPPRYGLQPQVTPDQLRVSADVKSKLPIYDLRMEPQSLEMMDGNPYAQELYPVVFTHNGEVFSDAKIRYRGAWGRTWPKKPMKLFFTEAKTFNGQRRVNLNSAWRDPAFIRETLAYQIYEASGVPSSKSRLVRVHLNNQFRGLYVEVEQPDKAFLKARGLKGATIFKASSRAKLGDERDLGSEEAYHEHYEQETQKDEQGGYKELHSFCAGLQRTRDAADFFNNRVDLEKYVNYLAASILIQNWDGFNKNHFLVYDGEGSKKWFVLPWDLDRSLGDHWDWSFGNAQLPLNLGTRAAPGVTGWNRMMDRFFSNKDLRAKLADRLQELIEKEFTTEKLFPVIDRLAMEIGPEAELDRKLWPGPTQDYKGAIDSVKQFIKDRRVFVMAELPGLRQ